MTSEQHKPRLLLIGGGAIVTEGHLPALKQLGLSASTTILDLSPVNLARARAIDPEVTLLQADFRTELMRPENKGRFDAALISLPNALHAEAVRLGLRLGLDVLCEKPLANDLSTCQELVELADTHKRLLAVAMVRRCLPNFRLTKLVLAQGTLGEVLSVEIEHGSRFAWPADSGSYFRSDNGGLMLNMGVHYIDQLEELFGELTPISHWDDAQGGVDCNGEMQLTAKNGITIRIRLSYTHKLRNEVRICGTLATLRFGVEQFDSVDIVDHTGIVNSHLTLCTPFESGPWLPTFEACFIEQLSQFLSACQRAQPVAVDGKRAMQSAKVIERSYALKQAPPLSRTANHLRPTLPVGKTLVTGASGFVGGALIQRLAELSFGEVITPVRSFSSAANIGRFHSQFLRLDLCNRVQLREQMQGCRYVFHLAYGSEVSASQFTIDSTKAIVDTAIECGVEKLVVVSTASVFGTPVGRVDEHSEYAPSLGAYGRSKAEAERYVLQQVSRSKGTQIVVICPSAVYGPGGPTFTEMPARLARQDAFCWISDGVGNANYVFVDNLVDALILAAAKSDLHGERLIVSDGMCTWKEFLSPLIGEKATRLASYEPTALLNLSVEQASRATDLINAAVLHNPAFMATASRHWLLGPLKRLLTSRLPGLQARVQSGRASQRASNFVKPAMPASTPPAWLADLFGNLRTEYVSTKARERLGWQPIVELAEGQERACQWLRHIQLLD